MNRGEKFPQAILGKAFRGELVLQDLNDGHAEKLLERIRQEQACLKEERREKRPKGRRPESRNDPRQKLLPDLGKRLRTPRRGPSRPSPFFLPDSLKNTLITAYLFTVFMTSPN